MNTYLLFILMYELTHFRPIFLFYTPRKRQETSVFLTLSGVIEMEHWSRNGLTI